MILGLPFSKRRHVPNQGKANANTPFLIPLHPLPILAFAGNRDRGSGFPVPHPGIRGFLEMGC